MNLKKVWWKSKTVLVNVVGLAAGAAASPELAPHLPALVPAKYLPLITVATAIANIALRAKGGAPLATKAQP